MSENSSFRINFNPGSEYAMSRRFWQGCPTVLCTPKGKLFAGWYSGGTREPSPEQFNILASSMDGGLTWKEPLLVLDSDPANHVRTIDIQFWRDPQNRFWLFWVTRDDKYPERNDSRHLSTWAMICEDPDASELVWSTPRHISPGFMRCQPTVLSDGRYILCAYDWCSDFYSYSESSDQGKTWQRRQGGRKLSAFFDETMVIERRDGSLWMLARSSEGCLVESFSTDKGKTWSDGKRSHIVSPSSRFFINRLPSGRLLLVRNNDPAKRCKMTVELSDDDGLTWPYHLLIDAGSGEVSYPDVSLGSDGTIYIVHDHGRGSFKEILLSRLSEEDIIAGKLVKNNSFVKNIISKAPAEPVDKEYLERIKADEAVFDAYFKKINNWD